MNVLLLPYASPTHLAPVVNALSEREQFGWALRVVPLGFGVTDYWECLRGQWETCAANRQDLMVVEHDVVIHGDAFAQFDACPEPMCVFTYWLGASYGYGLGCVRFRGSLVRMHRDAVDRAGRLTTDGLPVVGHWKRMDTRMWQALGRPHVHEPPVKHLHDYPMKEPCESASIYTGP